MLGQLPLELEDHERLEEELVRLLLDHPLLSLRHESVRAAGELANAKSCRRRMNFRVRSTFMTSSDVQKRCEEPPMLQSAGRA